MNALRHGLFSKCILIPGERQDMFDEVVKEHMDKLQPDAGLEHSKVENLAAIEWRQSRLVAIETRLLANAAAKRNEPDVLDRIAGAFSELAHGPELHLLHRYEGRLNRLYQRALENLFLFSDSDPDPKTQNDETNLDSNNPIAINNLERIA